jgi:hypothetical protein
MGSASVQEKVHNALRLPCELRGLGRERIPQFGSLRTQSELAGKRCKPDAAHPHSAAAQELPPGQEGIGQSRLVV